jgi:DNA-binding NtrC family response regulator
MQLNILIIGRHQQIMETVLRLINSQPEWKASGAMTDTEAIEKFKTRDFQLVMIGGGVSEESELKLSHEFKKLNQKIKIIRHYGGGSGLLFNEIREVEESLSSQ